MRELAILTFVTLDGVMQAPGRPDEDRSGGFDRGGWGTPYWEAVMAQVRREAMAAPYDMLFGRKTYELFAGHWPNADRDQTADMMNAAKKYVVSTTLNDLSWNNSELLTGDIPGEIAKLKAQDGPLLQVHGSSELIQTLLAHDLIDEFRLWVFPTIVGPGKRLFGERGAPASLELAKSEANPSGVVMTIYRRQSR